MRTATKPCHGICERSMLGSQVSQHREKDTLSRLAQFTSKLRKGPADGLPTEAAAPAAAAEDARGAKPSSRVDSKK